MTTKDLQEPLASELTATLLELAALSQKAASAPVDTLSTIANTMLERVLSFFGAQRGALLLSLQSHGMSEQSAMSSIKDDSLRAFALYNIGEEEAHTLLPTVLSVDVTAQAVPDVSCWMMYRLSVGEFMVEGRTFQGNGSFLNLVPSDENAYLQKKELDSAKQPLQAFLVVGWTGVEEGMCAAAIERSRKVIPRISSAVCAVITSILQAERISELETITDQEVLQQMELLKAELLGTVSHELRSPLASIKGYAATLLRHERRLSREERHQFLLAINEASDWLEVIIERLLEISQLETEAVIIHRYTIDMARLMHEAITVAEQRVQEDAPGRFVFHLHLEDSDGNPAASVPQIAVDPRRLREVLDNLLENAVKYSPEGGIITVVLRPRTSRNAASDSGGSVQPDRLEISISDTGIGIPAEHLKRIFDRFHRVDMRLTRESNGLGLGLTISKRIVQLHGGEIWAEGLPGKGSTFHVLLPISGEGAQFVAS